MNHQTEAPSKATLSPVAGDIAAPVLSVIVPIHNMEAYLRRCLDSLCTQSYHHLEIICVDDGSTDGSAAILREYAAKDARIRVVTKPNGGVSSARNAALDIARGEWIAAVDPDDYMLPGACSKAMAYATDGVGFVNFGVRVEAEPGSGQETVLAATRNYLYSPHTGIRKLAPELIYGNSWNVWNKLYRRSVIEEHGLRYDESIIIGEDMCFHMAYCAYVDTVAFCPSQLYVYTLRKGSATWAQDKVQQHLNSFLRVLQNLLAIYRQQGQLQAFAPLFAFLVEELDRNITDRAFLAGQPLLWRERILAQVAAYHLQEHDEMLPAIRELSEQLRSARRLLHMLQSYPQQATLPCGAEASHIAIPVDEAHAGQAALLAQALEQSATAEQPLCVHFLCAGLSATTRPQLTQLASEQLSICLHELPEQLLCQLPPLDDDFPHAACMKMALPWLLPQVERVLILTPGLLLKGSLPPLHSVEMQGMPVAVVRRAQEEPRTDILLMDLGCIRQQKRQEAWVAACMFCPQRQPNAEATSFNRAFGALAAELPAAWAEWLHPATPDECVQAAFNMGSWQTALPLDANRTQAWVPTLPTGSQALDRSQLAELAPQYGQLRRRYRCLKLMAKLSWGSRRKHYKERCRTYRSLLCQLQAYFDSARLRWKI